MYALTSISPKHTNNDIQLKAIESWIDLGMKVFSFNTPNEVELLQDKYKNVTFITTYRTAESTFVKPYVYVNAILDWAKEQKYNHFCIINSDIELKTDKDTIDRIKKYMEDNIVMCNRVNYDNDYQGNLFLDGIDVFFIHRKYLNLYPQSMYTLGNTHWDYWIPYTATQKGIQVIFVKQDIAYHKNHAAQYNQDAWLKMGRFFQWENGLYQFNTTQGIGNMSKFVYNFIYNSSKRIEI